MISRVSYWSFLNQWCCQFLITTYWKNWNRNQN